METYCKRYVVGGGGAGRRGEADGQSYLPKIGDHPFIEDGFSDWVGADQLEVVVLFVGGLHVLLTLQHYSVATGNVPAIGTPSLERVEGPIHGRISEAVPSREYLPSEVQGVVRGSRNAGRYGHYLHSFGYSVRRAVRRPARGRPTKRVENITRTTHS